MEKRTNLYFCRDSKDRSICVVGNLSDLTVLERYPDLHELTLNFLATGLAKRVNLVPIQGPGVIYDFTKNKPIVNVGQMGEKEIEKVSAIF